MALDVRLWLESLGLGTYARQFADNHVDERVLVELTTDDLKEIGVLSVGHRRLLLGAAARLSRLGSPADGDADPAPAADAPATAFHEAERRNLTVVFVDMVGSTELSGQLDPEDLRELLQRYQDAVIAAIVRHEGYVANIVGDGIVAYFGWPKAFEEQAVQAVRAALAAVAAVASMELHGRKLAARAGIASGPVVVGDIAGVTGLQAGVVSGEAPNLAARLQALAQPNGVVIAAGTHRLVAGFFECSDIGLHSLKGFAGPVQVFVVVRERAVHSRFEARSSSGLTQLVGRDEEIGFLRRRWDQAVQGRGQVVLLEGEPGIGKSRLARALEDHVGGQHAARIEWRCSPYHQHSAFFAAIEHCRVALGFENDESSESRLGKLEKAMESQDLDPAQSVPVIATLLSLPASQRFPPSTLDPERLKQKTLEVFVAWLKRSAIGTPALMVVEDLHWIDPSTLELLGMLVEQVEDARLLLLLTFRPDFRPPWPMLPHLSQLKLNRLGRRQVEEMIETLAAGGGLPADLVRHVVSRTDGVPLFVEELTREVIESTRRGNGSYALSLPPSGAVPGQTSTVPATLQDLLMARLDRLGDAREIAQLAAALGREFGYELIEASSPLDAAALQGALARLVEAELMYQRGQPPQAHYLFKHALIQDAAYQSLTKSTRQRYHELIARAIEARFPETVATQPELLARHYTEAGLAEQALGYWHDAGRQSIRRSANVEAINQLRQGLALCQAPSDTPEQKQRELALLIAIGVPLRATRGFASPEVGDAYRRALELCQQVGGAGDFVPVLRGLWEYHELRAEYQRSRELAERLLATAQQGQDPSALLIAHNVLGDNLLWLGEFAAARSHLEQGIALYDVNEHQAHIHVYGYDVGVACFVFGAWSLWFLGYPDQALVRAGEALELAQRLSHPFSVAFALQCFAQLHHYRGETALARQRAADVVDLASREGFPIWLGMGTIVQGWALAREGRTAEGASEIQRGLVEWRATGHELERPHFLGLLAEAYGLLGQPAQAIAALTEASVEASRTGEGFWNAELRRVQGDLLLQAAGSLWESAGTPAADAADPERLFLEAIEIARSQQARSLELRAAISLARLWYRRDRIDEARVLLEGIVGWFVEGFDTPDLKAALALLAELRSRAR